MKNTIVCVGDSLIYGKGWLNGSDLKRPWNTRLSEKYPESNVVNLGINGNSTSDIYNRISSIDEYSPNIVLVEGGINDISGGASALIIKNNLQNIYNYCKNNGYQVWGITITPRDDENYEKNAIREEVNLWIKNTAINIDKIIDAFDIIADPIDRTKRYAEYADENTPNHYNDIGLTAIFNTL